MEKETKLSLGLSILIGVITALLIIFILPLNQEPKPLYDEIDYIKRVDTFCYNLINENTSKQYNLTYKRGWGYAYRDCMLHNLNIKEEPIICDNWVCRRKETDYVMAASDVEICGRYASVSKYAWKAVCND